MAYALPRWGPSIEDQVSLRGSIASLALVALVPLVAEAQFTTFVEPPQRVDTVVVVDTIAVAADSARVAEDLKAWVDSAAGGAVDLRDTLAIDTRTGEVRRDGVPAPDTGDVLRNGVPAPDTATPLPLMLVAGAGGIAAGAFLLRRR